MVFINTFDFFKVSPSQKQIDTFKRILQDKSKIEIHTHRVPDIDAITSMMILSLILRLRKREVRMVIDDSLNVKTIEYNGQNWHFHNKEEKDFEVVILDTIPSRSTTSRNPRLIIDHHIAYSNHRQLKSHGHIVLPSPSTSYLIYILLTNTGELSNLDEKNMNIIKDLVKASLLADIPPYLRPGIDYKEAKPLYDLLDQKLNMITMVKPAIISRHIYKDWSILIVEPNHQTGYLANNFNPNTIVLSRTGKHYKFSIRTIYNNYHVAEIINEYFKRKGINAEFGAHYGGIGGRIEITENIIDVFIDIINFIANQG